LQAELRRTEQGLIVGIRELGFRRRRVRPLVRESATIGRIVNLRPAFLSGAASRATALIPERAVTSHLASIAAGSAFVLPTAADVAR